MAPERHCQHAGAEIKGGFDGVHVGAAEGSGIVGAVMERVHVLVQPLADVRDALSLPRVHDTMHDVEVGDAPVRDEQDPTGVLNRCLPHVVLVRQGACGPAMAEDNLNSSGKDDGSCGVEGIVFELVPFLQHRARAIQSVRVSHPDAMSHPRCTAKARLQGTLG